MVDEDAPCPLPIRSQIRAIVDEDATRARQLVLEPRPARYDDVAVLSLALARIVLVDAEVNPRVRIFSHHVQVRAAPSLLLLRGPTTLRDAGQDVGREGPDVVPKGSPVRQEVQVREETRNTGDGVPHLVAIVAAVDAIFCASGVEINKGPVEVAEKCVLRLSWLRAVG